MPGGLDKEWKKSETANLVMSSYTYIFTQIIN